MTSALQANSSKKHFKEGENRYLVCNSLLHAQCRSLIFAVAVQQIISALTSHMTYYLCFRLRKKSSDLNEVCHCGTLYIRLLLPHGDEYPTTLPPILSFSRHFVPQFKAGRLKYLRFRSFNYFIMQLYFVTK